MDAAPVTCTVSSSRTVWRHWSRQCFWVPVRCLHPMHATRRQWKPHGDRSEHRWDLGGTKLDARRSALWRLSAGDWSVRSSMSEHSYPCLVIPSAASLLPTAKLRIVCEVELHGNHRLRCLCGGMKYASSSITSVRGLAVACLTTVSGSHMCVSAFGGNGLRV